jgi:hypothetical protein
MDLTDLVGLLQAAPQSRWQHTAGKVTGSMFWTFGHTHPHTKSQEFTSSHHHTTNWSFLSHLVLPVAIDATRIKTHHRNADESLISLE